MTSSSLPSPEYECNVEEREALEAESILLPSTRPGKRTVSGALLSPPSSTGSRSASSSASSASSASVSVRVHSFSAPNHDFMLPENPLSVAALEWIGFMSPIAEKIFGNFTTRPDPDQNVDELIDYVYGHILILQAPSHRDLQPQEALRQVGLNDEFRDALCDPDPKYEDIRRTQTLHYWVHDTLHLRYLNLLQLQKRLKNCAIQIVAKKGAKRGKVEGAFGSQASSTAQQQASTGTPKFTATVNILAQDHHLPTTHVMVEDASQPLANHQILYKGKAAAEMGEGPWIAEDGSVQMEALATHSGGDFNHFSLASYWAPEWDTAETYRSWAARRVPYSPTWIIRIQVPLPFLQTLTQKELWYSPDWKEFVWYCRKKLLDIPAKFDALMTADLVKGHICGKIGTTITRIRKDQVQTLIGEDDTLRNGTVRAVQWVFLSQNSIRRLGAEIRGKIHIDITKPLEPASE